jgi:Domain of unknown function (DUF4190)
MKRCPACNQTYADDELSFCINDGTALVRVLGSSYDPQATIMSPPPSVTEPPPPPQSFDDAGSSGWNAPSSYSPPQTWNTPGAWQPPPPPNPMQGMPPAGVAQVGRQQPHPLAVVSLVCGLISITFGLICGGLPLGGIAIILGVIALILIKNDPRRFSGRGFAIAGIAIGALWGVFTFFWLLIAILGAIKR